MGIGLTFSPNNTADKLLGKTIFMAVVVATVMLSISCGGHKKCGVFAIADSLISTNVPEAIRLLDRTKDSIDASNEKDRMVWSLLRVKAGIYNFQTFTSDSLVQPFVDYFEKHDNDKNILGQAYYYAGKVYLSMNDNPQATALLLKALATIPEEETNLRGRTYNQLGYIYSNQWLDSLALSMFEKADSCYKASNDTMSCVYTQRDIADIYADWDKIDSAMMHFKQALAWAKQVHNDALIAGISAQIAGVYTKKGQFIQAERFLKPALDYNDPHDQSALLSIAARVYWGLGDTKAAKAYCEKIMEQGNVYSKRYAHKTLADFYTKRNDVDKALYHIKQYGKYTDSVSSITATEVVKQENDRYNYSIKERENTLIKEENNRKTAIITILLTVMVTVCTISFSTVRHLQQKKKIQQYKLEKYKTLINHIKEAGAQPKHSESMETSFDDTCIGKKLKQMRNNPMVKARLSDEEWTLLDETVNAYHPNFNKNVTDLCKMSLHDYRICLLIKAGQPLKFICEVMNISYSGLNSVRAKLYKRAFDKKGTANDWDEIVASL